MKIPGLKEVPAAVDRWDAHRLLEATLEGLRAGPPDGLVDDYEETREEVERLLTEIEDEHPELRPPGWRHPWGSAARRP